MCRSIRVPILLLVGSLTIVPASVHGQGFGIYEQSACAMSRGNAGVAEPCEDGSAIYVNPAAVAGREGTLGSLGLMVIRGTSTFDSDAGGSTGLADKVPAPPVHGYFQKSLPNRLAFGVGAYVPYGLGVKWPTDFAGRFLSYDSTLTTFYVQPTIAYEFDLKSPGRRFSVGGGPTIAHSTVELNRREDLARVPLGLGSATFETLVNSQTDFANTTLSGSASGVGWNAGALFQASEQVRVGVQYLAPVTMQYEGDATFSATGGSIRVAKPNPLGLPVGTPLDPIVALVLSALPNQTVSTEFDMPAQFAVGVSVHPTEDMKVLVDYQWVGWSAFDTVTLDFSQPATPDEVLVQDYRDTSTIRVGVERLVHSVRVSGGYFFNQAAAPDENVTPLLPEARRNHFSGGVGFTRQRLTVDVGYQFVHHADRRGRLVNPLPGQTPTTALNSGLFHSSSHLVAATVTFHSK